MRRGFTIAEALVALALAGVVIGALLFAFSGGTRTVSKGITALDDLATTALVFEQLRMDLRGMAGPLPPRTPGGKDEWTLELLRLDSVDPMTGRGLYLPVRWHVATDAAGTRVERQVEGDRQQWAYDGRVTLDVEPEAAGAIRLRMSFHAAQGPRRAPIETVLQRQDSGAAVKLVGGVPRIPRARLLPDLDAPWRLSPGASPAPVYPRELDLKR